MAMARYRGLPAHRATSPENHHFPETHHLSRQRRGGDSQPRENLYVLLSVRMQNPGDMTITRRTPVRRS